MLISIQTSSSDSSALSLTSNFCFLALTCFLLLSSVSGQTDSLHIVFVLLQLVLFSVLLRPIFIDDVRIAVLPLFFFHLFHVGLWCWYWHNKMELSGNFIAAL